MGNQSKILANQDHLNAIPAMLEMIHDNQKQILANQEKLFKGQQDILAK